MTHPNKLLYSTHLWKYNYPAFFWLVKTTQRNYPFSYINCYMQQSNLFNFSYWKTCRICTKDILDSDTGFLLLPILLGNIHHIFESMYVCRLFKNLRSVCTFDNLLIIIICTPVYKFINDRLADKSAVLKPLS